MTDKKQEKKGLFASLFQPKTSSCGCGGGALDDVLNEIKDAEKKEKKVNTPKAKAKANTGCGCG